MTDAETTRRPRGGDAQAARRGEDELIARWLEPDPDGRGPAAWRVTGRGPEIWALAGYLEAAADEPPERQEQVLQLAAADFLLPVDALRAALRFYGRHRAAIDARAEANRPPATAPAPGADGRPG